MPATTDLPALIPVIQSAISPMILISGVGLLLISMSNRLGRIIDRTRKLAELRKAGAPKAEAQIRIVWRRARMLRVAMTLAAFSILLTAINIILLFLSALSGFPGGPVVVALFVLGMLSLIGALSIYILEINWSIKAIALELEVEGP